MAKSADKFSEHDFVVLSAVKHYHALFCLWCMKNMTKCFKKGQN